MIRPNTDLILINGQPIPYPDDGFSIKHIINVDAARNTNGTVVGQVVGRPLWKLENLKWSRLTPDQWRHLKNLIEPFFVAVTFTADDNTRHTVTMYPGDKSSRPFGVSGLSYNAFLECSFNLIDCGRISGASGEA